MLECVTRLTPDALWPTYGCNKHCNSMKFPSGGPYLASDHRVLLLPEAPGTEEQREYGYEYDHCRQSSTAVEKAKTL